MSSFIETPGLGEILLEEFMAPMDISPRKLARDIFVPESKIQDILHDREKITPNTSLRLGRYFGVSERYFLNIQNDIDIRNEKLAMKDELARIKAARPA